MFNDAESRAKKMIGPDMRLWEKKTERENQKIKNKKKFKILIEMIHGRNESPASQCNPLLISKTQKSSRKQCHYLDSKGKKKCIQPQIADESKDQSRRMLPR
jgi:hypothetical protein